MRATPESRGTRTFFVYSLKGTAQNVRASGYTRHYQSATDLAIEGYVRPALLQIHGQRHSEDGAPRPKPGAKIYHVGCVIEQKSC